MIQQKLNKLLNNHILVRVLHRQHLQCRKISMQLFYIYTA